MFLTIKERAQAALAIANKVLEFGPRAPEFTAHIQAGINEFQLAAAMFGLAADDSASSEPCTIDEAIAACPELAGVIEEKVGVCAADGNRGPFLDFLSQLLANPALMQIVLMLLKIQLPTT